MLKRYLDEAMGVLDGLIAQTTEDIEKIKLADHSRVDDSVRRKNELVKKFEELAKSKSTDQGSAANGGELGWFGQSQMVKPFADAAFALKKGEVTQKPVKSNFGYHVILKEDSKAAGTVGLNEVKPQIEGNLKMEKFRNDIRKRGDELRSKAKVEYK